MQTLRRLDIIFSLQQRCSRLLASPHSLLLLLRRMPANPAERCATFAADLRLRSLSSSAPGHAQRLPPLVARASLDASYIAPRRAPHLTARSKQFAGGVFHGARRGLVRSFLFSVVKAPYFTHQKSRQSRKSTARCVSALISKNSRVGHFLLFQKYFQQFSVGGLSFSQYLFDECSDSMQEAISGATATIIYGLRIKSDSYSMCL